jgi:chitin synthase
LSPYAFSNTNDISWGTKGADTVDNDLGTVKGHGNEVEVELPAHQHDVDASYSEALDKLRVRAPTVENKVKSPSEDEQGRKDYYVSDLVGSSAVPERADRSTPLTIG